MVTLINIQYGLLRNIQKITMVSSKGDVKTLMDMILKLADWFMNKLIVEQKLNSLKKKSSTIWR